MCVRVSIRARGRPRAGHWLHADNPQGLAELLVRGLLQRLDGREVLRSTVS